MYTDLKSGEPVFFDDLDLSENGSIFEWCAENNCDMNIYSEIDFYEKELDTSDKLSLKMDYCLKNHLIDIAYEYFRDTWEIEPINFLIKLYEIDTVHTCGYHPCLLR